MAKSKEAPKLDESVEKLLGSYIGLDNFKKVYSRDPGFDNFRLRSQIKDEMGEPMYTQPAGVVVQKFDRDLGRVVDELSTKTDQATYGTILSAYPLSDNGVNRVYFELAGREVLPDKPSDSLKQIVAMAEQANGLEESVYTNKFDDVVKQLDQVSNGNIDYQLSYQYNLLGQNQNVGMVALRYADMLKRVGASKISTEIKSELDAVINSDNKNRALAAAERYRVFLSEKAQKEREAKSKKD